jgi:hypothetical protein
MSFYFEKDFPSTRNFYAKIIKINAAVLGHGGDLIEKDLIESFILE